MFSIIVTLIVGGLAGWLAGLVVNKDGNGVVVNVVVGIIGALLGNFLLSPVFGLTTDLSNPTLASFLLAVLGSVVLLVLVNLVTGRKAINR